MSSNTDDLWREADALFEALLDKTPQQRLDALTQQSISAALRTNVERLLAAHDGLGILDHPRPIRLSTAASNTLCGRRLGRWELQQEIGRGGMAVVYRAQSDDGSQQVAALKLLTLGARAEHGLRLFHQEQAVLARLRHPHVASLFEAGIAEDGTPWLAMALVEGTRIDLWCEQRRLLPRAIVELWVQVANAVAYAHRNLVIHRDIKPSNVLVDADGLVRLLDFGIARLTDTDGGNTITQWRALTPDYAAPEQFSGAPPSVAMDMYGLGALLYRLLTGKPPRTCGADNNDAITAPSKAAPADSVARVIRGDLDAIVLKALAHDPAQRYETVQALTQDARAWLTGSVVSARAPSQWYRLGCFVRRHKVGVAATAAILTAMLVGTGVAVWQANHASVAAQQARTEAQRAQQQAARATASKEFLLSLFGSATPAQPGGAAIDNRAMLKRGVERVQTDSDLPIDLRIELLSTINAVQLSVAWYDDSRQTLEVASGLMGGAADASSFLRARLLHEQAALELAQWNLERALELLDAMASLLAESDAPEGLELRVLMLTTRGTTQLQREKYQDAIDDFMLAERLINAQASPSPESRMHLAQSWGTAAFGKGDYALAMEKLRQALALQRRYENAGNSSVSLTLNHLASASLALGLLDDAIRFDQEALDIARHAYPKDHPHVADAVYSYGESLYRAGRFEEAMAILDSGRSGDTTLIDLARVRVMLALGRYSDAAALAEQSRTPLEAQQGANSMAALALLSERIAALALIDSRRPPMAEIAVAEQRLSELDEQMRWSAIAQRLRWRVANTYLDAENIEQSRRWMKLTETPAGVPGLQHRPTVLALRGLSLRLAARDDRPRVEQLQQQVLAELGDTSVAFASALAYVGLCLAESAELGGDVALARRAVEKVNLLAEQAQLPAEQLGWLARMKQGIEAAGP